MNQEEKELLEKFRKLAQANQAIAQSNLNVALSTQQAMYRQYGLLPEVRHRERKPGRVRRGRRKAV